MRTLNDVMYNIFGGYTPEEESVDKNNTDILYTLESVVNNENLDALLEVSTRIQNDFRR